MTLLLVLVSQDQASQATWKGPGLESHVLCLPDPPTPRPGLALSESTRRASLPLVYTTAERPQGTCCCPRLETLVYTDLLLVALNRPPLPLNDKQIRNKSHFKQK